MPARARRTLLTVAAGEQRCALPVEAVLEVHPMVAVTELPGAPAEIEGAVDAHGEVIGVVDLRRWLHQPVGPPRPEDRLVLVDTGHRRLALHADGEVSLIDVPIDALDGALRSSQAAAAGIALLDEGLMLVADLERLLSAATGSRLDAALEALVRGSGR